MSGVSERNRTMQIRRPLSDRLAAFPRLGLADLPTPPRADEATDGASRRTAAVDQARRCDRARVWRQQVAQARLCPARGTVERRRYDRLRWRRAIEQPAAGGRGGGKARPRLPSCGLPWPGRTADAGIQDFG